MKKINPETLEIEEIPDSDADIINANIINDLSNTDKFTITDEMEDIMHQALGDYDAEEFTKKYKAFKKAEAEWNEVYEPMKKRIIGSLFRYSCFS